MNNNHHSIKDNFNAQELDEVSINLPKHYKGNDIYEELTIEVPDDTSILTTDSPELRLVSYFFESVTCGDKGIEQLLYEIIGCSISKVAKLSKAFILKGEARNGKSKVFRIVESLVSEDKVSHEHLENLSGSKAGSKSTVNRLKDCCVNISEDQKNVKYVNTSLLTRIISGEPISIQQKGTEGYDFTPYSTLLFSTNEVIDFKEVDLYITDRFLVVPFNATFTDSNNNRNIHIGEQLCETKALQIIVLKSMAAFNEVLKRGKFTIPPSVEQATIDYFLECNIVAQFCEAYPIKSFISKSSYYNLFRKWCTSNNKEPINNSLFGKRVLALNYRSGRFTFGGKRDFYYLAPSFNNLETRDVYNNYITHNGISEETATKYNEAELMETFGVQTFDNYLCDCLCNKDNIQESKSNN